MKHFCHAANASKLPKQSSYFVNVGYTGGSLGQPSDTYLTSLATTLASGFVTSVGEFLNYLKEYVNIRLTRR